MNAASSPKLPPQFRQALLESAKASPSPTRAARRRSLWLGYGLGALVLALCVMMPEGIGPERSSGARQLWPILLSAAIAAAATVAFALPELSPRRRPSSALWGKAALTTAALLLAPWLTSNRWAWPTWADLDRATGATCLPAYAMIATFTLAATWRGLRRTDLTQPRETGIAMGVLVGAWASLVLNLRCGSHDLWHLVFTHTAPVLLFMVVAGGLRHRLMARHFNSV